jgi:hypothetical protein
MDMSHWRSQFRKTETFGVACVLSYTTRRWRIFVKFIHIWINCGVFLVNVIWNIPWSESYQHETMCISNTVCCKNIFLGKLAPKLKCCVSRQCHMANSLVRKWSAWQYVHVIAAYVFLINYCLSLASHPIQQLKYSWHMTDNDMSFLLNISISNALCGKTCKWWNIFLMRLSAQIGTVVSRCRNSDQLTTCVIIQNRLSVNQYTWLMIPCPVNWILWIRLRHWYLYFMYEPQFISLAYIGLRNRRDPVVLLTSAWDYRL